jgi:rubrerythrin
VGRESVDLQGLKRSLQLFHALEVHQVALYRAQAALGGDEVDKRMFTKAAEVETGHVQNIHAALVSRGWAPLLWAPAAWVIGSCVGLLKNASFNLALRTDIALENKAMEHYLTFIESCDDEALKDVLWSNYLDESLHTEWFKARLAQDVDQIPLA